MRSIIAREMCEWEDARVRDSETGVVTASSYLVGCEAESETRADCPARTERPQKEVGPQPRLAGRRDGTSWGL